MRIKAYITYKGKFRLTYIGRTSKNGNFHFRNKQLKKACYKKLKETFCYDCEGGSLAIPNINNKTTKYIFEIDKYITCYSSIIPENINKEIIATYWKK